MAKTHTIEELLALIQETSSTMYEMFKQNDLKISEFAEKTEQTLEGISDELKKIQFNQFYTNQSWDDDDKLNKFGYMYDEIDDSNDELAKKLFKKILRKSLTLDAWIFDSFSSYGSISRASQNIYEQYEMILENSEIAAIVNINYTLTKELLYEQKETKSVNFRILFPNNKRKIVLVAAAISISKEVLEIAKDLGIFVITISDNQIKILNSEYQEM